jgi:hypothetical protein
MALSRRRFVAFLGAIGADTALPRALESEPERVGSVSYEQARSMMARTKLFFVPYGHNDYGWLNSNLWDRVRTPLVHKEALEIMRHEKEFKWFFDELKQRVKEGRWGVSAGSFCNPDNLFMEPEAIVRNLVLGRRDFQAMFPGVNLEVATFNDIHAGFSQIPQVMRKAGYRFYRVTRPNEALDKEGYKREFIWEGLDGSEIIFSHGPYTWQGDDTDANGRPHFVDINNYGQDWERAVVAFYESAVKSLLPDSASGLIYLPLGFDYGRPLRVFFELSSDEPRLNIPGFVREWKKRESVPLLFATPIEYFTELVRSLRQSGAVPVARAQYPRSCGNRNLLFPCTLVGRQLPGETD